MTLEEAFGVVPKLKMGQKVWFADNTSVILPHVFRGRVSKIVVYSNGDIRYDMEAKGDELVGYFFDEDEIGKTVFLSKKEAEAALKERETKE